MTERFLMVIAKEGLHIPDPFKMYRPIETGKPVKVKKSTYWNRRIKQGDVKLFVEAKKTEEPAKKPVKKVVKKVTKNIGQE